MLFFFFVQALLLFASAHTSAALPFLASVKFSRALLQLFFITVSAVSRMSAPKRERYDESAVAAPGGAGGAPPRPPPPPARRRPATRSVVAAEAYERRLKLTDVIGFVAQNGYAREASRCAGLCRETWRCIPAGLSAADADRVRRDHPLWQAIIDLKPRMGFLKETRLGWAARCGHLARVRELCDWRADIEAADYISCTPLIRASTYGHHEVVRELLSRGANTNAVDCYGSTALLESSSRGHVEVVRALLAVGADKHHVNNAGTATSLAGSSPYAPPGSRDAILTLLVAAP